MTETLDHCVDILWTDYLPHPLPATRPGTVEAGGVASCLATDRIQGP